MMRIRFFLLVLLIGIPACKKGGTGDTDVNTAATAALKIIKSKTWKPALTDKTPNLKPVGSFTYFAVLSCRLDDVFNFGDNDVLTINSGTDRCSNNSQPVSEVNSYKYDATANQLYLDGIQYNVLEITPDQIKLYVTTSTGALVFLFQ